MYKDGYEIRACISRKLERDFSVAVSALGLRSGQSTHARRAVHQIKSCPHSHHFPESSDRFTADFLDSRPQEDW